MALVVEDGTGLSNAEAYCSVANATTYHNARGNADAWDAIEDKEAALRLATDYLTQKYRGKWQGKRTTSAQALDWPRTGVKWTDSPAGYYADNALPMELVNACAELALRTAAGPLLADLGRETLSETVDVISVTYAEGRSRQTAYAAVDGWLTSLLGAGSGSCFPVVRA